MRKDFTALSFEQKVYLPLFTVRTLFFPRSFSVIFILFTQVFPAFFGVTPVTAATIVNTFMFYVPTPTVIILK